MAKGYRGEVCLYCGRTVEGEDVKISYNHTGPYARLTSTQIYCTFIDCQCSEMEFRVHALLPQRIYSGAAYHSTLFMGAGRPERRGTRPKGGGQANPHAVDCPDHRC